MLGASSVLAQRIESERRSSRSRLRLSVLMAVAACSIAATIAVAEPASACDLNTHCYGIAGYSLSGILGVHATVAPYYLTSPSSNFVTDEIWLSDSSGAYWVEIGYIANYANIDGLSQGTSVFWFDSRPGGGQHGHVLLSNPSLTARTFYVMSGGGGPGTFTVGDGTLYGLSTSNSMTPYNGEVGSETTSSKSCSRSHDYSMGYSVGAGWVAFPSAWTSQDSPQQVSWISSPTNMEAGVWC